MINQSHKAIVYIKPTLNLLPIGLSVSLSEAIQVKDDADWFGHSGLSWKESKS